MSVVVVSKDIVIKMLPNCWCNGPTKTQPERLYQIEISPVVPTLYTAAAAPPISQPPSPALVMQAKKRFAEIFPFKMKI